MRETTSTSGFTRGRQAAVVAVSGPSATGSLRRSKLMLGSRIAFRRGLRRDTCVLNPGGAPAR